MTPELYNAKSSQRYGWNREDLLLPDDATWDDVTLAVKDFQNAHFLVEDGKVGPATWRRIEAARELLYSDNLGYLRINNELVPVDFKTKTLTKDSVYSLVKNGGHGHRKTTPTQVIWHWDAALSADSCHRILKRRRISSHGIIDNDGTFIQLLDFAKHTAWHAGNSKVNKASIGIDVSNAVYLKYQSYYTERWGSRPEISATIHGHKYDLLGYYPAQIATAKALAAAINKHLGIKLLHPDDSSLVSRPHLYKGHLAHYHVKSTKYDVAGFPFSTVLGA